MSRVEGEAASGVIVWESRLDGFSLECVSKGMALSKMGLSS